MKETPSPIHVRLPSETLDVVRALAVAEDRPISAMVRVLVQRGIAADSAISSRKALALFMGQPLVSDVTVRKPGKGKR